MLLFMVIVLIPFYIAYFIISNIRFGMYLLIFHLSYSLPIAFINLISLMSDEFFISVQ